jgi:Ino eighty subunit 1
MTTDPLEESDDEMDENTRLDLCQSLLHLTILNSALTYVAVLRLKIINRLRGKEPTPEPEMPPASFAA